MNDKNKKEKKTKKKVVPFDKIDITTATEDEIIRSGIKYNKSVDYICYLIMFIIVVLASLPVVFRIFMPKPVTTETREIVYLTLTCYKTLNRDNYELSTTAVLNYRDSYVKTANISFSYYKRNSAAVDGYTFYEIEAFEKMNNKGVEFSKQAGKANIIIDFENYPDLKNDKTLKDYSYMASQEASFLQDSGYDCITKSEQKMEVVDIETGKKVK